MSLSVSKIPAIIPAINHPPTKRKSYQIFSVSLPKIPSKYGTKALNSHWSTARQQPPY